MIIPSFSQAAGRLLLRQREHSFLLSRHVYSSIAFGIASFLFILIILDRVHEGLVARRFDQ